MPEHSIVHGEFGRCIVWACFIGFASIDGPASKQECSGCEWRSAFFGPVKNRAGRQAGRQAGR